MKQTQAPRGPPRVSYKYDCCWACRFCIRCFYWWSRQVVRASKKTIELNCNDVNTASVYLTTNIINRAIVNLEGKSKLPFSRFVPFCRRRPHQYRWTNFEKWAKHSPNYHPTAPLPPRRMRMSFERTIPDFMQWQLSEADWRLLIEY